MGIPFECDLCHFRNINGRDPLTDSKKDDYLLLLIRRASLDAFWSRETSTVSGNFRRLQRDYFDITSKVHIRDLLPVLGSDKVEDRVGMKVVVTTLNTSTRAGKYQATIQWDTMRDTPTCFNNAYKAGEGYGTGEIYSSNEKKVYESSNSTSGRWFPRFM